MDFLRICGFFLALGRAYHPLHLVSQPDKIFGAGGKIGIFTVRDNDLIDLNRISDRKNTIWVQLAEKLSVHRWLKTGGVIFQRKLNAQPAVSAAVGYSWLDFVLAKQLLDRAAGVLLRIMQNERGIRQLFQVNPRVLTAAELDPRL